MSSEVEQTAPSWPGVGGEVTGWVWLSPHVVGNPDDGFKVVYEWNCRSFSTRALAIKYGLAEYGSDDFNVAFLSGSSLVWFGWMDEQHPTEDYPAIAEQFGWSTDRWAS